LKKPPLLGGFFVVWEICDIVAVYCRGNS